MIGLSTRIETLTSRQRQISDEIAQVVPELPTVLSDLISQLAVPDFSLATQKLELDNDDRVFRTHNNQQIIDIIEIALTSPSSECEPGIKAQIFLNATDLFQSRGYCRYLLKPYLVQIFDNLQDKALQINLDGVVLTDLNLSAPRHINFKGVSAKGATFHNVSMDNLNMEGGDFTGAKFIDVCMARATLSQAIFIDATWSNIWFEITTASELVSNQSGILQRRGSYWQQTILSTVTVQAETACLAGRLNKAMPDMKTFTLPVPNLTVTQRHPGPVFRSSGSPSCNLG